MSGIVIAQGLEQFIVPLLVFGFYILASVLKNMAERKPNPPNRRPAPPPPPRQPAEGRMVLEAPVQNAPPKVPPPRPMLDPEKELQRMLEELKLRRPEKKPTAPPPPVSKKPRRPEQPVITQRPPDSRRAVTRELRSGLEQRHAEQVHSGIETQHVDSAIPSRTAAAAPRQTASLAASPEISLVEMVGNSKRLREAFIMGVVLGPPLAIQEKRR